ncbi:hypothetical protein [Streptomyces sp. NRRL WC-3742]|uniref:hypothetical protein n=1 Tax=Streptomyces sp. NRRL WC-3742 TaxID=1463934 RepID=UPI0004C8961E|nr:hypothetical protein [Streptomyces sp. NRRL WC-3742]
MAEELKALSDLESKFAKFHEMSDLITLIKGKTDEINRYNKSSAGNDDIGKQYHENVDRPTEGVIKLFSRVSEVLDSAGQGGRNASQILNDADHDASGQA